MMKTIRIGVGAGYAGDRIDPAAELAERGSIGYLVFECLAERTIALAQRARLLDPEAGYDPLLEERMDAVLPLCAEKKIRIVSNMGAAHPMAAARKTREIAQRLGIHGMRIAAVTGDDVLTYIRREWSVDSQEALAGLPAGKLVSANVYMGAEAVVSALEGGADVVLTGRVADSSLFLAILVHEFGWSMEDWNLLGQGTVIGHLLECAGQITGGYFADPPYSMVPGLAHLGFPLAEVTEDGVAVISKVDGSGGQITKAICTEQLLYEIQDPTAYFTPDVVADFSQVALDDAGADRIRVSGGRGRARPDSLKVSAGYHDGYVGEGQISYAGPGALTRAELARDVVAERLRQYRFSDLRMEFIGVNAIHSSSFADPASRPNEVRLRIVGRADSMKMASRIPREVEALYTNGPAAGGGVVQSVKETIGILPMLMPRTAVAPRVDYEVS
ncbi:MAG TPA: acyclic terpene utilization AtuA family protein [Acidobacteriaceae bacterium]|nr:acyclic terpene utilization AtuA family protein [Acidobacteriaceae bacterium]